jgi:hypothetical protein
MKELDQFCFVVLGICLRALLLVPPLPPVSGREVQPVDELSAKRAQEAGKAIGQANE